MDTDKQGTVEQGIQEVESIIKDNKELRRLIRSWEKHIEKTIKHTRTENRRLQEQIDNSRRKINQAEQKEKELLTRLKN